MLYQNSENNAFFYYAGGKWNYLTLANIDQSYATQTLTDIIVNGTHYRVIKTDGDGNAFLADNGEYKEVNIDVDNFKSIKVIDGVPPEDLVGETGVLYQNSENNAFFYYAGGKWNYLTLANIDQSYATQTLTDIIVNGTHYRVIKTDGDGNAFLADNGEYVTIETVGYMHNLRIINNVGDATEEFIFTILNNDHEDVTVDTIFDTISEKYPPKGTAYSIEGQYIDTNSNVYEVVFNIGSNSSNILIITDTKINEEYKDINIYKNPGATQNKFSVVDNKNIGRTDKSLTASNVPADAKATGDKIAEVANELRGEMVKDTTIVKVVSAGQNENGDNVYKQIYGDEDNPTYVATFTAPKGETPIIAVEQGTNVSGQEPNVTVVNSNQSGRPKSTFTFSNIKGEKGEKGDKGAKGDKGDTGSPLYSHLVRFKELFEDGTKKVVGTILEVKTSSAEFDLWSYLRNTGIYAKWKYYSGPENPTLKDWDFSQFSYYGFYPVEFCEKGFSYPGTRVDEFIYEPSYYESVEPGIYASVHHFVVHEVLTRNLTGEGFKSVEANVEDEATDTLNNLKVGETVYSIPSGGDNTLKGETAPTAETVGTIGQFYTDTTSGTSYQCTSIADGIYTWVKLIKETDIAQTNGDYGLVKLGASSKGIALDTDGTLKIRGAEKSNIDQQVGTFVPIMPTYLGYAIKQGLTNPNLSTVRPANWTDEDRAKARETLGIAKIYLHTFEGDFGIGTFNGYFHSTKTTQLFEVDGSQLNITAEDAKTIIGNITFFIDSSQESFDSNGLGGFTTSLPEDVVNLNYVITEV